MLNYRTKSIIKRELKERLFSKTFILMTTLIPLFMFGIIAVQVFLNTLESDDKVYLEVISENPALTADLREGFQDQDYVKDSSYVIQYKSMTRLDLKNYLEQNKTDLLEEKITGIVFIPETALQNKDLEYYSHSSINNSVFNKIRWTINKVLVDEYFAEKELSDEEISYARNQVDFTGFRVSKDEGISEEGFGNRVLSYLFAFLLYMSLLILGSTVMRSVVEEKTNRIVEILLSSVDAKELMAGKIIGSTITGVIQMFIWLLPVFFLISNAWFSLPPEFTLSISIGQLFYFLLNYLVGLVIFIGLFAAVGAIFSSEQDAQSGTFPLLMLIMIPFFIALSMIENPQNPVAEISSMLPFASIIVMPSRMTLVEIPLWQFIVSIVVNIGTIAAIFPFAGKIYRIGILSTGKKPKWSEVVKWLKYKY